MQRHQLSYSVNISGIAIFHIFPVTVIESLLYGIGHFSHVHLDQDPIGRFYSHADGQKWKSESEEKHHTASVNAV